VHLALVPRCRIHWQVAWPVWWLRTAVRTGANLLMTEVIRKLKPNRDDLQALRDFREWAGDSEIPGTPYLHTSNCEEYRAAVGTPMPTQDGHSAFHGGADGAVAERLCKYLAVLKLYQRLATCTPAARTCSCLSSGLG
jgi:hypothetical protein